MSRPPIATAGTLRLTCRDDRRWSGWQPVGQPLTDAE